MKTGILTYENGAKIREGYTTVDCNPFVGRKYFFDFAKFKSILISFYNEIGFIRLLHCAHAAYPCEMFKFYVHFILNRILFFANNLQF